jgi:hypothetical protein
MILAAGQVADRAKSRRCLRAEPSSSLDRDKPQRLRRTRTSDPFGAGTSYPAGIVMVGNAVVMRWYTGWPTSI